MRPNAPRLFVSTALVGLTAGLLVTDGSPCDRYCGNVLSSTSGSDIACDERSFGTTSAGIVFQTCVDCELKSTYSKAGQTDLQWLLCPYAPPPSARTHADIPLQDNLRYAISWCLFGVPNNKNVGSSPCITR